MRRRHKPARWISERTNQRGPHGQSSEESNEETGSEGKSQASREEEVTNPLPLVLFNGRGGDDEEEMEQFFQHALWFVSFLAAITIATSLPGIASALRDIADAIRETNKK